MQNVPGKKDITWKSANLCLRSLLPSAAKTSGVGIGTVVGALVQKIDAALGPTTVFSTEIVKTKQEVTCKWTNESRHATAAAGAPVAFNSGSSRRLKSKSLNSVSMGVLRPGITHSISLPVRYLRPAGPGSLVETSFGIQAGKESIAENASIRRVGESSEKDFSREDCNDFLCQLLDDAGVVTIKTKAAKLLSVNTMLKKNAVK